MIQVLPQRRTCRAKMPNGLPCRARDLLADGYCPRHSKIRKKPRGAQKKTAQTQTVESEPRRQWPPQGLNEPQNEERVASIRKRGGQEPLAGRVGKEPRPRVGRRGL